MTSIFVLAINTFRQTMRQRLLYNIAIFGVGMVLVSMVIGNITFGYPDRVVRSIGLSGVAIALDLIALLVGVTLIHQEIDRKTLFVVLIRPIERWQYVCGRYLGLLMAIALMGLGLSVVFIVTLLSVGGTPGANDFIALLAAVPEAALLGGIGLTLSAFSTPTLSAGIGLGLWLSAATTDDLVRLTAKAESVEVKYLAKFIYYALPSLHRLNFREAAIYQDPVSTAEFVSALGYGALYACALVAIASLILSRREML